MTSNGTIDTAAAAKLPPVSGTPVFLSQTAGDRRRDLPVGELAEGHQLARECGRRCDDRGRRPARAGPGAGSRLRLGRHRAVLRLRRRSSCCCRPGSCLWNAFKNPTGGFSTSAPQGAGQPSGPRLLLGLDRAVPVSSAGRRHPRGDPGLRGGVREPGRRRSAGSTWRARACSPSSAASPWRSRSSSPSARSACCSHASWYYDFPWGIALIYAYFQIPLMVLVFLPAIDGLKIQWREATENLGGSAWQYWRHVGGPLLAPAFLGCGAAAVRQRAVGLRDDRGLGEPDRLHRAAADQHGRSPARSGWPTSTRPTRSPWA